MLADGETQQRNFIRRWHRPATHNSRLGIVPNALLSDWPPRFHCVFSFPSRCLIFEARFEARDDHEPEPPAGRLTSISWPVSAHITVHSLLLNEQLLFRF